MKEKLINLITSIQKENEMKSLEILNEKNVHIEIFLSQKMCIIKKMIFFSFSQLTKHNRIID